MTHAYFIYCIFFLVVLVLKGMLMLLNFKLYEDKDFLSFCITNVRYFLTTY